MFWIEASGFKRCKCAGRIVRVSGLMDEQKCIVEKQDEFVQLLSRHSQRIYEFILTLVTRQSDAEEIFQNTSLVLWKKFDSYDHSGNFRGWACRIAYLEVLELRRKGRRLQTFSEEALELLANNALAHSDDLSRRRTALEDCLEKLMPHDREMVEQRYYQRRAPKEIAVIKSCSVYSVYRALARVHTALLHCVQGRLSREEIR
jgi:RNA polymerase sigma-70 factor, ECF subfamily